LRAARGRTDTRELDPSCGYPAPLMFFAHNAPVVEPLLFAPAFIAVAWSLVRARRRHRPPHRKELS